MLLFWEVSSEKTKPAAPNQLSQEVIHSDLSGRSTANQFILHQWGHLAIYRDLHRGGFLQSIWQICINYLIQAYLTPTGLPGLSNNSKTQCSNSRFLFSLGGICWRPTWCTGILHLEKCRKGINMESTKTNCKFTRPTRPTHNTRPRSTEHQIFRQTASLRKHRKHRKQIFHQSRFGNNGIGHSRKQCFHIDQGVPGWKQLDTFQNPTFSSLSNASFQCSKIQLPFSGHFTVFISYARDKRDMCRIPWRSKIYFKHVQKLETKIFSTN